jgi:hypothetical protein
MKEEINRKIQSQVDHLFRSYEGDELKQKVFDLAFEWYLKGSKEKDVKE